MSPLALPIQPNFAQRYLIKAAMSKWRLLFRKLINAGKDREAQLLAKGMGHNNVDTMGMRLFDTPRGGYSLATATNVEKAVPEALGSITNWASRTPERGLSPFVARLREELNGHMERSYGKLHIPTGGVRGAGLETGTVGVAPSARLSDMLGSPRDQELVLRYSANNPMSPVAKKIRDAGLGMPMYGLKEFEPSSAVGWEAFGSSKRPVPIPKIYTWFEPKVVPTTATHPVMMYVQRLKQLGLVPTDLSHNLALRYDQVPFQGLKSLLERGVPGALKPPARLAAQRAGQSQLGIWEGRYGHGRVVPMDYGTAYEPGAAPSWSWLDKRRAGGNIFPSDVPPEIRGKGVEGWAVPGKHVGKKLPSSPESFVNHELSSAARKAIPLPAPASQTVGPTAKKIFVGPASANRSKTRFSPVMSLPPLPTMSSLGRIPPPLDSS